MERRVHRRSGRHSLVSAVVAAGLVLVGAVSGGTSDATAADMSRLRVGSLISDELFFSGGDMSATEVQTFLDARAPGCVPSPSGVPCLKSYRTSTPTLAATAYCSAYQGSGSETAAQVVAKVSSACGVSARVLLVLLQKEQGLVTASGSSLTARRYEAATGYGCPDGAPCNAQYYGFFNQVYRAASRFVQYSQEPTRFRHQPGAVNSVLFHPDATCGSSSVLVVNRATAALYNYTPYQPNAASIAAGAGTGDRCSSYGNRNFWRYYTDWFGETQLITRGAINGYYWSGQHARSLSIPLANEGPVAGGHSQRFRNGTVFASGYGTFATLTAMDTGYRGTGGPSGPLGFPSSEVRQAAAGIVQQSFANGHAYTASGRPFGGTIGAIDDKYQAQGGVLGTLGWPQGLHRCGNGCVQDLRKDSGAAVSIVWSAGTGAHVVSSAIRSKWLQDGGVAGPGFPLADEAGTSDGRGSVSEFRANGRTTTVLWSGGTGARSFGGPVRDAWYRGGGVTGLGYATTDEVPVGDGVGAWARFSKDGRLAAVLWSRATGAHHLAGSFLAYWTQDGGVGGLGYPLTDEARAADGVGSSMDFRRGTRTSSLVWHPSSGVHAIGGSVRDAWLRSGGVRGLGYPVHDEVATADGSGSIAEFRRGGLSGVVLWSPGTGAAYFSGPALATWRAGGGLSTIGYPVGDERLTGRGSSTVTRFTSGTWIVADPSSGVSVQVPREIAAVWTAAGGATGSYGLPRAAARVSGGTVTQAFEGGTLSATVSR